jgi:hypothetical protein
VVEHVIISDVSFTEATHFVGGSVRSDNMCIILCERCGAAAISILIGPEDREAALRDAWEDFLYKNPWDCDVAIVEGVMEK